MQKARELEEVAAFVRNTEGQAAVEFEFHYAEKLHAMSLVLIPGKGQGQWVSIRRVISQAWK